MHNQAQFINRILQQKLLKLAQKMPAIAVLGPRQSGKTTLATTTFPNYQYVSLEDPDNLEFATTDPRSFFKQYANKVIIDEAQKAPKLFSYLQTIIDSNPIAGNFILTGSQNFLLQANISQSLAGRVAILTLLPLSMRELINTAYQANDLEKIMVTGFYPKIYAAKLEAQDWYPSYIQTYLERDVRQLKNVHDLGDFQRFVKMCAGRTGQLLNLSSLANDCGITYNTAKAWLSLLEASFIVFLLQPYYRNFGKRLIKAPKLYFYDIGVACSLLGIDQPEQLQTSYLRGSLFENLVISELIKHYYNQGKIPKLYFWRDQVGHEIDCIYEENGLIAIELKSGRTITQDAFANLRYWKKLIPDGAGKAFVIYGGDTNQLRSDVTVVSWKNFSDYPS